MAAVVGTFGVTSVPVFADTAPAFKSATYNVSTGELVVTGSNLATTSGTNNDIDPSKIAITDSVNNNYTLTTKAVEIKSSTEADITLNAKDEVALASFLDQNGAKALNRGTYQINVLSGWDGSTSTTDISTHALTVSDVPRLDSAAYDLKTGTLTLTGNMVSNSSSTTSDITPKCLTITDSATKVYTLTTVPTSKAPVKVTDGTTAVITLNVADQCALQGIFDNTSADIKSKENNTYNIIAVAGWNGSGSTASMAAHAITVSDYVLPTVTMSTDITLTYGSNISIPAGAFSKPGTVYVVPSGSTYKTQADLDSLVTDGVALGASVTDITKATTISTKTSATNPYKLTKDTQDYYLVEVDSSGVLSSLSSNKVTINNVAAPSLTVALARGTISGIRVTATACASDSLAYEFSTKSVTIPKVATAISLATDNLPVAGSVYAYTSGNDINGVDPVTNKYLEIYELDSNNKVVKFKQITVSALNLTLAVASTATATTGTKTITYTLSTGTFNVTNGTVNGNWTFGGTNKADLGAITGVVLSNSNHTATITVTNNVGSSTKNYTVVPKQAALSTGFAVPAATTVTVQQQSQT